MIAILGASGYIGKAFVRYYTRNSIEFRKISRRECDYYNPRELKFLLKILKPQFLINCAGYTGKPNVDACEDHKAECLAANAYLPYSIGQACLEANVPWGHVASGCIYQGDNGGKGFKETDPPNFSFRQNNCSFYSGTKALSEELMGEQPCYQWRLRIPFDEYDNHRNYIYKVLNYDTLLDVRNSLSHLGQFVHACHRCLEDEVPCGVYNMTNGGSISTREVAELIGKHLKLDRQFKFFEDEDEFMRLAAKTPRSSCVLDNSKALEAGIVLAPVEEALISAIKNYKGEISPN